MRGYSLCLVLLFGVALAPGPGRQSHGGTGRTFAKFDLAVQAIREAYAVRTGFEVAAGVPDVQPIDLDLDAKDVSRVFGQLVSERPAYAWALDNGVYNLYPASTDVILSDTVVHAFVLKDANRLEASQELNRLPELHKWLTDHHLIRREIINESTYRNQGQRISLSLSDVSVRRMLNDLIDSFGDSQWSISYYGDRRQYVGIYF